MRCPRTNVVSLCMFISAFCYAVTAADAAWCWACSLSANQPNDHQQRDLFERIQRDDLQDLDSTYRPIRHLLSLLALRLPPGPATLDERLPFAAFIRSRPCDNPKLASIYLGYEDGDSFAGQAAAQRHAQAAFQCPRKSRLQVWSIDRSSATTDSDYLFFDGSLNP